jgi:TPR repeat protein
MTLEQACGAEGGDGQACGMLGYLVENGRDFSHDHLEALGWYERGCARGHVTSCTNHSIVVLRHTESARDRRRAIGQLGSACGDGVGHACWALASAHASGNAGRRDLPRARTL